MTRSAIATAARTVVKVGSSSLTSRGQLDPARLDRIVDALARRHRAGQQVVLVSSGAIVIATTVRGTWDQPLVNGRAELRNASFNHAALPNGKSFETVC